MYFIVFKKQRPHETVVFGYRYIGCNAMKNYPANVRSLVQNVFRVHDGQRDTGTAFQIEVERTCYWVTAAHFAEKLARNLYIWCQNEKKPPSCQLDNWCDEREEVWIQRKALLTGSGEQDGPDVAFLELLPSTIAVEPFKFSSTAPMVGQEALFLGFPLGLALPPEPGKRYPVPLMKRGIISGFNPYSHRILIDGITVPGHSGGPVVVIEQEALRIIGVVGGSLTEAIDASATRSLNSQLAGHNPGIAWATDLQWAIDTLSQDQSVWKEIA